MEEQAEGFFDFFRRVPDHRIKRKKLYPVEELLLIAFCGVMAGCDSWDDFEVFGTRLEALRRSLLFKQGALSDDTLRRFFRTLDPAVFETCFKSLFTISAGLKRETRARPSANSYSVFARSFSTGADIFRARQTSARPPSAWE